MTPDEPTVDPVTPSTTDTPVQDETTDDTTADTPVTPANAENPVQDAKADALPQTGVNWLTALCTALSGLALLAAGFITDRKGRKQS